MRAGNRSAGAQVRVGAEYRSMAAKIQRTCPLAIAANNAYKKIIITKAVYTIV